MKEDKEQPTQEEQAGQESDSAPESDISQQKETPACSKHGKDIRWQCKRCKKGLCQECNPVGFGGDIYCKKCIDKVESEILPVVSGKRRVHKKPLGVILFSMWHLFIGVAFVFVLILASLSNPESDMLFSAWSEGAKVGLGVLCGFLTAWNILMAIGLFFLKKWGMKMRFLTTVVQMVLLIVAGVAGIVLSVIFVPRWLHKIFWILGIILTGVILFFVQILVFEYFDRDNVKKALLGK